MFCSKCQSLDLDELLSESGLKHHVFSDLCAEAKKGCELCAHIRTYHEDHPSVLTDAWNPDDQITLHSPLLSPGETVPTRIEYGMEWPWKAIPRWRYHGVSFIVTEDGTCFTVLLI
jgi:hypothetical protein